LKKIIFVVLAFIVSIGAIEAWGPNTALLGIMAISAFLAGLFIGQRRKHA